MGLEQFANNASSTLNGAINNVVTTLVVQSATLFPTQGQFRILIDSEIMLVTGVSGTTYTVTRGTEGTTAASHSNGVPVTHILTAAALNQITGLTAPVQGSTRTITTSYTVDSTSPDFEIWCNSPSAAINLTLPTPTAGRTLRIRDIGGQAETNNITLVRHGSESINGLAASRILQTNFGLWIVTSDGTNWQL